MTDSVTDPVHGVRMQFERKGDDLSVQTWMEDGGGLPKHFHPQQTEVWWVIDGEVDFYFGDSWRALTPASGKVTVEPDVVHGLRNKSGGEAHLGCDVTPALGLEGFLTDSARAAQDGYFMKGGIPKSLKGARWAAGFLSRYEDETVMVFPPRFLQKLMRPLAPK